MREIQTSTDLVRTRETNIRAWIISELIKLRRDKCAWDERNGKTMVYKDLLEEHCVDRRLWSDRLKIAQRTERNRHTIYGLTYLSNTVFYGNYRNRTYSVPNCILQTNTEAICVDQTGYSNWNGNNWIATPR